MNPLIIALDVDEAAQAWKIVDMLGSLAGFYKVGMELYAIAGMPFVTELNSRGKRVFLDLKLYDIGETVKRATRAICKTDAVTFLTVHGSRPVMEAAVAGRGDSNTKLFAVTVLTSFDKTDLADLGYQTSVADLVDLRVRKAVEGGMDGVICSPLEVARVRQTGGAALQLVTPGVRSGGAAAGDQKRVATPIDAIRNGADYIVVGRQVTRAEDPRRACENILTEISSEAKTT